MVILRRKEGLWLISNHCNSLWNSWGSMALNKVLHSTRFLEYSSMSEANEYQRFNHRKVWFDSCSGSSVNTRCGLSLRGCLDRHDGSAKARAMAVNRQLVRDPSAILRDEVGLKLVNGNEACKNGRPLGSNNLLIPEKMVVAVDVDEALNKFIADRYSLNHTVSDYYVYEFFRIWNCSRAEADIRVHEFFKTHYFTSGIHPIPGARDTLHKLSSFCNLSVVTSRQNVIKDHTLQWIEQHYPGLFQEIHFGNHFALDGKSKPKSEICRSLGAQVLIDDNPRYALECAEIGIRVLLFDYYNSYPWCKNDTVDSHPLVTRVKDWEEVEQNLASLVVS
ncbi:uncharacterized protein LOC109844630 isoform X2 [Asparagus officinalis]|uniref:uncharacterized protein LOC109844630 isoform X2 n=1 Tax=Asparagus officinalis TaxID=4686 RepID=UPI00098DEB7C|nr:uncharacterized protein LOC109844630 isoform X2 [Asparagus officinalis]